jgi:hypothetical protein
MTSADDAGADPSRAPGPAVETGREGASLRWRVGDRRVEMSPTGAGWEARVRAPYWGGQTLRVDGVFGGESEARAWCERMAAVFAADAGDEAEEETQDEARG